MSDGSNKKELLKILPYTQVEEFQRLASQHGISLQDELPITLADLIALVEHQRDLERLDCAEVAYTLINSRSYSQELANAVLAHIMRKR